jgi:hypothetical protein
LLRAVTPDEDGFAGRILDSLRTRLRHDYQGFGPDPE